ncbi:MAG: hypothetical protein EPGJADBJ_01745 [Saprospiraceae bacterium]|nr:hypothetical protein [Saprospiraceae bacterium]
MNFPMKLYTVDGRRWTADGGLRPWWASFLLLLLLPLFSVAQSDKDLFPPKPEPAVYVHDYAGWLTPHEKTVLEEKLVRYHDSTTTQIVVMIRPDIGDYDKASYAFELGNRWGIGRKDKNNGVVLLVKTEQPGRGAFIATGYGTEGALPDITAGRIIRNTMIPYFQREQYAQGIEAGVDEIIRALSGEFKNEGEQGAPIPWWVPVLIVLLIFLFVFFMAKMAKKHGTWYTHSGTGIPRRSRRRRDDDWGGGWWMGGGGGGGGWGSGGGGWGGGGGSFGGGSFGGGGAGGDW